MKAQITRDKYTAKFAKFLDSKGSWDPFTGRTCRGLCEQIDSWRGYNLRYLGLIGNSFRQSDINRAISFEYDANDYQQSFEGSMGIDPAFGSSNFAITITALVDDKVRVVYSEEFERLDHTSMVELCTDLMQKYRCIHAYVDGANPGFIASLRSSMGEDPKYLEQIARLQKNHAKPELNMKVLPVNLSTDHKKLLANLKMFMSDGLLAIHPKFENLITSLNTSSDIENSLQKGSLSNSDSLDSLRLALLLYEYT